MKRIIASVLSVITVLSICSFPAFAKSSIENNVKNTARILKINCLPDYNTGTYTAFVTKKIDEWICIFTKIVPLGSGQKTVDAAPGKLYSVSGYCGTEKDIKIPTEINGETVTRIVGFIAENGCKSITIPKNVNEVFGVADIDDGYGPYYFLNMFQNDFETEKIVVEKGNSHFVSCYGVLYTKDYKTLLYYPPNKKDETFTVKRNVEEISLLTFTKNKYLNGISVQKGNRKYSAKDGVLYNKAKTELMYYPVGKKDKSFTIPGSVKKIGYYAFSTQGYVNTSNKYLKKLTVSENVKSVLSSPNQDVVIYYKNLILDAKSISNAFINRDGANKITYVIIPNVKTIYCFKDSKIHKAYKKWVPLTKIKFLKKPTKPAKATIKTATLSTKKKAVKLTIKKQNCYGFKVYRYSSKSKSYRYIGYTHSSVYYDKTVKSGKNYSYKVKAYNKKNLITANGNFSIIRKIKVVIK